jgi:streptogramin lyase
MQRILKNSWKYFSVLSILTLAIVACNGNVGESESIGSGPGFEDPVGIAVATDGDFVVIDPGLEAVVHVDQTTGDRTILSDANTGSGPGFEDPRGIAVATDGDFVVVDLGLEAVVHVDQTTGDRTILSDANTGSGP